MTRSIVVPLWLATMAAAATAGCTRREARKNAHAANSVNDSTVVKREEIVIPADSLRTVQTASSSFTLAPDSGSVRRYRAISQRFLFSGLLSGDSGILVRETQTELCCRRGEGKSNITIALAGWSAASSEGAPRWTFEVPADEGALWGPGTEVFYRATLHGCCDSGPLDTYVSLRTGRPTFFNSRFGSVDGLPRVLNRNRYDHRFVAFHDTYTLSDPPEARGDERVVVGILQYGPADGPVTRILVRQVKYDPNSNARWPRLERIAFDRGRGKEEYDIEALDFDAFDIVTHIWIDDGSGNGDQKDVVLRLPVRNDRIIMDQATVPASLVVSPLPAR